MSIGSQALAMVSVVVAAGVGYLCFSSEVGFSLKIMSALLFGMTLASFWIRFRNGERSDSVNTSSQDHQDVHQELAATVSDFNQVLSALMQKRPSVHSSMTKVISYTEQSASEIGGCVIKIHGTSESQLKHSMEIAKQFSFSDSNHSTLSGALRETTHLLQEALNMMAEFIVTNQEVQQTLNTASHSASAITNEAKLMNELALTTRLLAFNARIEASRAGHHGLGFGVVADEVGELANHAKSLAQNIQDVSRKINDDISAITSKISSAGQTAQQKSHALRNTASQVLEMTTKTETEIKAVAMQALQDSKEISQNINGVISHLQFQDLTRQEIEKTLAMMDRAWGTKFKNEQDLAQRVDSLKQKLETYGLPTTDLMAKSVVSDDFHTPTHGQQERQNSTFGEVILFKPKEQSSEDPGTPKQEAVAGDVILF
jgi:methyl-accepting chemotaxis protein